MRDRNRLPVFWFLTGAVLATGAAVAAAAEKPAAKPAARPKVKPAAKPIDIPLKTWIARKLPALGKGPASSGAKHIRLAHNPENGRIYFCGGDYAGLTHNQSGRNELWSYSIADGDWKLEYPYTGPAGDVQPSHPDETGWTYDSSRKVFWMVPGGLWFSHKKHPDGANPQPGAATLVADLMSFDPATRKWSRPRKGKKPMLFGNFTQYDPKEDTLIAFGQGSFSVYDIKADKVKRTLLVKDTQGVKIDNEHLELVYAAMDLKNRRIYVIAEYTGLLMRYDMSGKTFTVIAKAPVTPCRGFSNPVWDSVNEVILYPYVPGPEGIVTLYIYHPDTGKWEKDEMKQPEKRVVLGNCFVFDPQQNVLLSIGTAFGKIPATHFYLYRYGGGKTVKGR
jgi:hypothetical protein